MKAVYVAHKRDSTSEDDIYWARLEKYANRFNLKINLGVSVHPSTLAQNDEICRSDVELALWFVHLMDRIHATPQTEVANYGLRGTEKSATKEQKRQFLKGAIRLILEDCAGNEWTVKDWTTLATLNPREASLPRYIYIISSEIRSQFIPVIT